MYECIVYMNISTNNLFVFNKMLIPYIEKVYDNPYIFTDTHNYVVKNSILKANGN